MKKENENIIELKNNLIKLDKAMDDFLKDYNQLYSKNIKYISEDKISNLHFFRSKHL